MLFEYNRNISDHHGNMKNLEENLSFFTKLPVSSKLFILFNLNEQFRAVVIVVYRPTASSVQECLDNLKVLLGKMGTGGFELTIFSGDVHIDL